MSCFSNQAPILKSSYLIRLLKSEMSLDCLLLIITHWKNEAHELFHQLEYMKKDYQEEYNRLQQRLNQSQYENNFMNGSIHRSSSIKNNDLLKQLLINVNQASVSDQLSVLCDFFVDSLKTLLLSKIIGPQERSNIKFSPIIETIQTNIRQIENLIKKMDEDCSNQLSKSSFEK